MRLRDALPAEFFREFADSRAGRYLEAKVLCVLEGHKARWPGGDHANVHNWYLIEGDRAVGWNENPRGWRFPCIKVSAELRARILRHHARAV